MNHSRDVNTKLDSLKTQFHLPSDGLIDKKKVSLGGFGPAFREFSIEDKGKVSLGGFSPVFRVG